MIRKPTVPLRRESATVANIRAAATGGVGLTRAGGYCLRGVVCWGFALLWGFAALAAGASLAGWPTFIGVGAMAAGMAWWGTRMFAKARACLPSTPRSV